MAFGNGIEEGLMQQVRNPSHTDPARPAVLAGLLVALVVWSALSFASLPQIIAVPLAAGLGIGLSAHLLWRARARRQRTVGEEQAERRKNQRAEREKQLAEFKSNSRQSVG